MPSRALRAPSPVTARETATPSRCPRTTSAAPVPPRSESRRAPMSRARKGATSSGIAAMIAVIRWSAGLEALGTVGTTERSPQEVPGGHTQHVLRVLAKATDRGGLEPRVHGAVLTPSILARLPVRPVGLGPELIPVLGVGLADQVARALPA